MVLFFASGIGNGSTFRTIGVIFDRQQAGPVLGWTSAIAAYGAFIAPVVIGDQGRQIKAGTPQFYAMYGFAIFYAPVPGGAALNWWFYLRRGGLPLQHPLATASLLLPAVGIGLAVQDPTTPLRVDGGAGAAVRPGRRQLRQLDGQHQLLLSQQCRQGTGRWA
jgi:hypothetical protein